MQVKTKKWLGIGLVAGPFILLVGVMMSYSITSFVISSLVDRSEMIGQGGVDGGLVTVIGNVVNIFLGFLGIVSVLGIFIGIPLGVILIVHSADDPSAVKQREKSLKANPHYHGNYSEVVKEKKKALKRNPHYNS